MKERPIGHLVDALRQGGKDWLSWTNGLSAATCLWGISGGSVDVDGTVSSQFLTALLMMAPLAQQDTTITIKGELVSKPYIDITLALISTFGGEIENQNYQRLWLKVVNNINLG